MKRQAIKLARYNAWANDMIFKAVAALPPGEATKPRQSVFRNMVHTLNHNYVIDRIFQAHLEGRAHGYTARNTQEHPELEELRAAQREIDDWYIAWSERVAEAELDEIVPFTFVGGGDGRMSRFEILMHLVTHTSYHRGYVADMFYQVPARPPTTDLTVYLRDVHAEHPDHRRE
jgi:uncharacterized damage-inducible protein DinB